MPPTITAAIATLDAIFDATGVNEFIRKMKAARAQGNVTRRVVTTYTDVHGRNIIRTTETLADGTNRVTEHFRDANGVLRNLDGTFAAASKGGNILTRTFKIMGARALILIGAFAALIPLLGAMLVDLSPLIGLLATLPGIAMAAAAGIGGLVLAFQGVGDALKALQEQEKNGAKEAQALGDKRRDAAYAVREAERTLTGAQRDQTAAQKALTDARREAVRELDDLKEAASDAAESERDAVDALADARANLIAVQNREGASADDIRKAREGVSDAEEAVSDARTASARAQEDAARADRKGVEGSDAVTQAKEAQKAAIEQVRASTRQLSVAQRELRRANDEETASAEKVREAFEGLSPEAAGFVRFLHGMSKAGVFKELRAAAGEQLFPRLTAAIQAALPALGSLQNILRTTGGAIGGMAQRFGEFVGTHGPQLERVGANNVRVFDTLGRAGGNFAEALTNVAEAAGPLTQWLADTILKFSQWSKRTTEGKDNIARLEAYLVRTKDTLRMVARWVKTAAYYIWEFAKQAFAAYKDAKPFIDNVLKPLLKIVGVALIVAMRVFGKLLGWVGSLFGWLGRRVGTDAYRAFADIKSIIDAVKGSVEALAKALPNLIKKLREAQIANVGGKKEGLLGFGGINKFDGLLGKGKAEGGRAQPGQFAFVGDGKKTEWVISQEGNRTMNRQYVREAAAALGGVGFAKGGRLGPLRSSIDRYERKRDSLDYQYKRYEGQANLDGEISGREHRRLVNYREQMRDLVIREKRAVDSIIPVLRREMRLPGGRIDRDLEQELQTMKDLQKTLGRERKDIGDSIGELKFRRDEELRERVRDSLDKTSVDSAIIAQNRLVAEAGLTKTTSDDIAANQGLLELFNTKLGELRGKLAGATAQEDIDTLNGAITGVLGDIKGLQGDRPTRYDQIVNFRSAQLDMLTSFGGNLGGGGARGGATVNNYTTQVIATQPVIEPFPLAKGLEEQWRQRG